MRILRRNHVSAACLAGALMACAPLSGAPQPGLVASGATTAPPIIDGRLDEDCWKNTIEAAPFIRAHSSDKKAMEQTTARICHDKKNLYLAFRCEQTCLIPERNQLHAFKKDCAKNDDDKLFQDDWVAVMIKPDDAKDEFFDIFVNANGAVNDALCSGTGAAAWEGRNKKWDSGITARSNIENGVWTLECSIPLEKLKTAPVTGKTFGLELGRRNCAAEETSAWQPMLTSFHNPAEFGRLAFENGTPQISGIGFSDFTRGPNSMRCSSMLPGGGSDIRLESSVWFAGDKGADKTFKDFDTAGKKMDLSLEYQLKKEGVVAVQFAISNPLNLKTWYRSPAYESSVRASSLKADIAGDEPHEIYLNGEKISGDGFLLKGENVVCVKTGGPVRGALSVGDAVIPLDETWKYSPSEADGWRTKAFRDNAWTFAKAENGTFKEKGFYRKSIVLNSSRFWPNWTGGGVSIAQNSVQQLFLVPEGLEGRTLADYHFLLEIPEAFEVLGASGYYKTWKVSLRKESEKIERAGGRFDRYRVSISGGIPFNNKLGSHQFICVAVRLPETGATQSTTEFRYHMTSDKGNILEIPQKLPVNILPPLRGAAPARQIVQIWADWLSSMDDEALKEKILSALADNGFNSVVYHGALPPSVKIGGMALLDFNGWNIDCAPYLKAHPEEALVDFKGERHFEPSNPRRNHVCTSRLLEDSPAWAHVEKSILAWSEKNKAAMANWDYENSVWDDAGHGQIVCFCPLCLEKFKEFAKLPPDTKLDPKTIKAAHASHWTSFMNTRMALLAGKLKKAVSKISDRTKFSVYSAYQSGQAKVEYGIDWSLLADKVDFAMCGYGRPKKDLEDTIAALGKTPLVTGELVYPYEVSSVEMHPLHADKATLLRRLLDGTGGILVFSLTQLDGRTFFSVAEISRLVKEFEPLFVERKWDASFVKVSGAPQENVSVLAGGRTRLVVIINEDKTPRRVTLSGLASGAKVRDYFAGRDIIPDEKASFEIAPHDVLALVCEKTD